MNTSLGVITFLTNEKTDTIATHGSETSVRI
jgi:hypothetical protein